MVSTLSVCMLVFGAMEVVSDPIGHFSGSRALVADESAEITRFDLDITGDGVDEVWLMRRDDKTGQDERLTWQAYARAEGGYHMIGAGRASARMVNPMSDHGGRTMLVDSVRGPAETYTHTAYYYKEGRIVEERLGESRLDASGKRSYEGFPMDAFKALSIPAVYAIDAPDTGQEPAVARIYAVKSPGASKPRVASRSTIELAYSSTWSEVRCNALVKNLRGEIVREIAVPIRRGLQEVIWDGENASGKRLYGEYSLSFELTARDDAKLPFRREQPGGTVTAGGIPKFEWSGNSPYCGACESYHRADERHL